MILGLKILLVKFFNFNMSIVVFILWICKLNWMESYILKNENVVKFLVWKIKYVK